MMRLYAAYLAAGNEERARVNIMRAKLRLQQVTQQEADAEILAAEIAACDQRMRATLEFLKRNPQG